MWNLKTLASTYESLPQDAPVEKDTVFHQHRRGKVNEALSLVLLLLVTMNLLLAIVAAFTVQNLWKEIYPVMSGTDNDLSSLPRPDPYVGLQSKSITIQPKLKWTHKRYRLDYNLA